MVRRALFIWLLGLVTWVPYGTYYVLFVAEREQYALYIAGVLFWLFGYWTVVGPLISLVKVRRIMRLLERADTLDRIKQILREERAEDLVIEVIAKENRIPKWLARRLLSAAQQRLQDETVDAMMTHLKEPGQRP